MNIIELDRSELAQWYRKKSDECLSIMNDYVKNSIHYSSYNDIENTKEEFKHAEMVIKYMHMLITNMTVFHTKNIVKKSDVEYVNKNFHAAYKNVSICANMISEYPYCEY